MISDYISLFKLRIAALLVFVAVVSAITAGEGNIALGSIAILVVAGAVSCMGSACLNNYFDRDIDKLMDRNRHRPLPAGKIKPANALYLGLFLIPLGVLIASRLNYLTALFVLLGAVTYIVVYTIWLKRCSSWNIVIGGFAGSCASLAGWTAIQPVLSATPVILATVLFLWTPSHFWNFAMVHNSSYGKAGIPMLPLLIRGSRISKYILLNTTLLVIASLMLYFSGALGITYLAMASLTGSYFIWENIQLCKNPVKEVAWKNYKLSGIYLLILLLAILIDVI